MKGKTISLNEVRFTPNPSAELLSKFRRVINMEEDKMLHAHTELGRLYAAHRYSSTNEQLKKALESVDAIEKRVKELQAAIAEIERVERTVL